MHKNIELVFSYITENLDHYFSFKNEFSSLELFNLNDDYVIHFCIFIVTIICIFVICILNNFYQTTWFSFD